MFLYYITDRKQFSGSESRRRELLLAKIAEAARAGIDYIQLREKDLPARELEALAREAVRICRQTRNQKPETKVLINSRSDVALAAGANGVHLPSGDIPASDARAIWSSALTRNPKIKTRSWLVAVSCHTVDEVRLAEAHGADFAIFGPVFEKAGTSLSVGLDALRAACRRFAGGDRKTEAVAFGRMPVLAIGGITLEKARACLEAGAGGLAAIRLFQENDVTTVVEELRKTQSLSA